MVKTREFAFITSADFIVRTAYQMGKSPLLPVYAASLGATDIFLGLIVSVSTLTGMLLKPIIGLLSDNSNRKIWLLIGTTFFCLIPFLYYLVETPDQLFLIRIIHGTATAIYGPVSLAFVSELSKYQQAERLGWFSIARNLGYVIGPIAAGWLLMTTDPVGVFTIIGLLSCLAFIPTVLIKEKTKIQRNDSLSPNTGNLLKSINKIGTTIIQESTSAIQSGIRSAAVWLAGGLESTMLIAIYAVKAFVPLLAISSGANLITAGAFLSIQEAIHIIANPLGGKLSDQFGFVNLASIGMLTLGIGLCLLAAPVNGYLILIPAMILGLSQALVFPSTMALVSKTAKQGYLATNMGMVGSARNAGKISGPIIGGLLIHHLDYDYTFFVLGFAFIAGSGLAWVLLNRREKPQ